MSIASDPAVGVPSDDLAEAATADPAAARQERLATQVAALRVRRGISLDRILLIVGSVLLPLGALFIVLGWYGAAHTPQQFEQIPYLISGGLLGVALVGAGGFFYFGYWLTRQVYEGRGQSEQLVAALSRIEARLDGSSALLPSPSANGQAAPVGNGRGRSSRGPQRAAVAASGEFVATASGTMLHRPDCAVVANREGLIQVAAGAKGYKPCRICDPLG